MVVKKTPKISVVTPSLNQGRFLQECINSIRDQSWPEVEHFVIDGGSTDETMDIIHRNQNWLAGYISEPDKGAADAINKGLAKCTGEIVAWLNADDLYLPGAFEAIADAYHRAPDASFWFGNGIRVDVNGHEKSVFNKNKVCYNHNALIQGVDYILQPSTFINRKWLQVVGFLNGELKWTFDWDLWIRLAGASKPCAIDNQLSASREWGETLTSTGGFRRAEEVRKLAERHSGDAMTPGALCYWLHNITNYILTQQTSFSQLTLNAMHALWREAQLDMRGLKVDEEGYPLIQEMLQDRSSVPLVSSSNRLTVAIDLYPLIAGVSGGLIPWVKGVFQQFASSNPICNLLMFHRSGIPPLTIRGDNVECIGLDEHPLIFYEQMSRICEERRASVLIRTYPQEHHPSLPFRRQIFVIPDIQHEFFPDFFPKAVLAARRRAFTYALSCGGAIATLTEHSKQSLIKEGCSMTDDVFLMPAALPEELRHVADMSKLPEVAKSFDQYFFMPANLWPHKNHKRLFQAFKLALPHLPARTGLLLSGNSGGLSELMRGFEDLPIKHVGFVSHDEMAALFKGATALVYFSLFEGFGMPLLEAFYHGTPVLCSNSSSLPEVGGNAVLSCDPLDVDAMAQLMRRISTDPGLRERLSAAAMPRCNAYIWQDSADALRQAIDRVSRKSLLYEKKEPLVSIVMPTRNHGKFIKDAIDSVLNQGYPKIELLVMDAVSTDDTVEILRSYGDRIRWISEPDKGQTDAINKGSKLLHGDILAYLNSDDILLPEAIEKVVGHFNESPSCDMVYGDADYIDLNGKIIGSYNTAEYSFERLMNDNCICQPAAFWRRRIAERIGPFDETMQTAMDYEYWLRMATLGGIIERSHEKLAQSRLHEDAKTLSMRGIIFKEIFEICKRHGGYVSHSYHIGLWHYRLYESWGGGKHLRRIAPSVHRIFGFLHFCTQVFGIVQGRGQSRYVWRTLFGIVDRRSTTMGRMLRKSWRYFQAIRHKARS